MGRVSSVWKAFAFFHSQSAIAAYRSSRKRALCQMYRTVLLQESASWKSKSAKTFLRTRRNNGPGTPWYGIADFMYLCIWGALLGSAACFNSDRRCRSSGWLIRGEELIRGQTHKSPNYV